MKKTSKKTKQDAPVIDKTMWLRYSENTNQIRTLQSEISVEVPLTTFIHNDRHF